MHFVVLFTAALLCEIASNIPVGSLPLALVSEGASESQTAIAMGCGMFAALLVSMPIGMLTDRIGKLPVLRAAAFSSVAIMLLMGCIQMALRSAAICAYMTAQFAYASGMFSKERAVSAVGAMGILGNVAFAAGPACGVWLWQMGIHREQYMYASILNLAAALMVLTLPAQFDQKPKYFARRRQRCSRRSYLPGPWYRQWCLDFYSQRPYDCLIPLSGRSSGREVRSEDPGNTYCYSPELWLHFSGSGLYTLGCDFSRILPGHGLVSSRAGGHSDTIRK
jgi:MFS family permease